LNNKEKNSGRKTNLSSTLLVVATVVVFGLIVYAFYTFSIMSGILTFFIYFFATGFGKIAASKVKNIHQP
jgi:hypothetical protein